MQTATLWPLVVYAAAAGVRRFCGGTIRPMGGGLVLAPLTLALVWLGVYPAPLIDLVQRAVAGLL